MLNKTNITSLIKIEGLEIQKCGLSNQTQTHTVHCIMSGIDIIFSVPLIMGATPVKKASGAVPCPGGSQLERKSQFYLNGCCCLWPLESHGRPEPRPSPAAPRTSSHSCSSSAIATGSSHRSRTVRVVNTLGHVKRFCVVCSSDLQIGHIGEGLYPGSSLYKYDWRKGDFPARS